MSEGSNKWHPGRRPGAVNRKTKHFQEVIEARGFDVAEALMDIYNESIKFFEESRTDPICGPQALKIVLDVTKEIASYSLPKLKSIEMPKDNLLADMTREEKLQVMKQAVAQLEAELSQEPLTIETVTEDQ